MSHTRQHLTTASAVSLDLVKRRLRIVDDYDDLDIQGLADAAALEIEAYTGLALLAQNVTVTLRNWSERIALPVGPFMAEGLADNPVTVELIEADGIATPHPAGWWIEPGRHPVLNLTRAHTGAALRIRYPAGFGTNADTIPPDLQLAIADQAARSYDMRGTDDGKQGLSLAAARIAARHRRVAV